MGVSLIMEIQKLVTRQVVACDPRDTRQPVARLLWEHDCGAIPVVDDERHLIGIITDRDICVAASAVDRPLNRLEVAGVMTGGVCACLPTDTVDHAERVMRQEQVRRVPVVDRESRRLRRFRV